MKGIKRNIVLGLIVNGLFFMVLSFGVYAQKKPEWMKDPESVFDSKQIVYAIGSGKSQEAAKKQAMEQLAGNISASVEAQTKLESEVTEGKVMNEKGKQKKFGEMTEKSWSQINVQSNAQLYNVTTEYYTDKKGMVYAAAWFPKEKTARICATMIEENNRQIQSIIQSKLPQLAKFGTFGQALQLAEENDGLLLLLMVLDPQRAASVPSFDQTAIMEARSALAREITFTVRAFNRDDGAPDSQLAEALTTWISGFGWPAHAASPDYVLEAGITFTEASSLEDLVTLRWILHLTVTHQGNIIGNYTKRGIQDHRNLALAKDAVYGKLPMLLDHKPEVLQHLFGMQ